MELLEKVVEGDQDAFEILFRQFQGFVYSWIVRIVRNQAAAEDLTVETFWRIWKSRRRMDPQKPFEPWARRIAVNLSIDYLKQLRYELPVSETPSPPVDPALRKEERDQIERAFRTLPADLRAVATLALIEELSQQEVAEALSIPLGTVKTRLFRASRLLRRKLSGLRVGNDR